MPGDVRMAMETGSRRRRRMDSSGEEYVVVEGQAHLCFVEDGAYFQGLLDTADHATFGLYGRRVSEGSADADGGVPVEYDVTLADLETGLDYSLNRVTGRNGQLCTFHCQKVNFTTQSVFRGFKADMIIQKFLGSGLVGRNYHVFAGPMKVRFSEVPTKGPAWCL